MGPVSFLSATQRLLRTLRATSDGYHKVVVGGALDANGGFTADKLMVDNQATQDWNPELPKAYIVVEDENSITLAQATWENGTLSGEIDAGGILSSLEWGWSWDDLKLLMNEEGARNIIKIPPVSDTDFGHALRQWLQGMSIKIEEIVEMDPDEELAKCYGCGGTILKDEAYDAEGEYYCAECLPEQCEHCKDYMPKDEAYYDKDLLATLCNDCYLEAQSGTVDQAWRSFNDDHPELKGALDKASEKREMDVDTYITIFEDFNWADAYGGEAWANIAKTWRDMEEAVSQLHGGGGDDNEWIRLTAIVDHTFDLVHNTGSLFTKTSEKTQEWLMQALEDKYFLDPLQYRDKLSADGRKLLDAHIRYSGGVRAWKKEMESKEQVMDRVEKSISEKDFQMAARVFRTHKLNSRDFYNRESFLAIAFWQQSGIESEIPEAVNRIRDFLHQPSAAGAKAVMAFTEPSAFKQGSSHHAASILRGQVLPKLIPYAKMDGEAREWLMAKPSDLALHASRATNWQKLLQREQKDIEETKTVAAALRAAAMMIKLALKQSDFYDFYASTVVDPEKLPDDLVKYARGFKRVLSLKMAKDLLAIIKRACIREANHVADEDAVGN